MSTVTASGCGTAASGSNFNLSTISMTAVSGRSLVVIANNESAVNDITGLTDSGVNTWVEEHSDASSFGNGRRVFRCKTIGTAPTWVKTSGSSGTIHYVVVEATGMDSGAIELVGPYGDTPGGTSHSATFSAATSNAMAIAHVIGNTDLATITPTNGFTEIPTSRSARAAFFKEDLGASGSKTITYTSSGSSTSQHLIAVYKSAVSDPTVSTVTGTTVTEGGNIVFTVTLSGATNRTTNYAASFSGTATSADYNNALGSATYSDGVIFSGGDFVVPSGVSSFTVTIATTQDALDEDNETLILTVGGTASTGGTITDDDASPALLIPGPVTVDSGDSVVASYTLGAVSGRVTYARLVLTDGTAVGGTNYTNTFPAATLSNGVTINAGVLSIPAGVAGFTITIPTT